MLVLTRKVGESIVIGREVVVSVLRIRGNKVRLGVAAREDVPIHRGEVQEAIDGSLSEVDQHPDKLHCA